MASRYGLSPDQFDLQTGEVLPSLNDDFVEATEGISDEAIADYGERLRLEHIEEIAARQLAVLNARQASNVVRLEPKPLPRPASTPQVKLPPEPRRIPGQVPPQWNSRLGRWEPANLYHYPQRRLRQKLATERLLAGDKRWSDPEFWQSGEADRLLDEQTNPSLRAPLPSLSGARR
jgi:hypothetical protein